ncbi:hypothetical protein [Dactylosporangium sp. CA-233914]|uniref:hypothetical protein n=1 Tax=Dactylosporangium sp. CA-233914 TaxID=3239934 RepID=UPI003D8A5026
MTRPSALTAFVDESFIHRQGHPGIYLLAAVLVEGGDLNDAVEAARAAAAGHEFHATRLHRLGHMGVVEAMLGTVAQWAGWTVVVAHTPIEQHREAARQSALQRLLRYLDGQKVSDVVLDRRADPAQAVAAQRSGQRLADPEHRDLRTFRHLVRGGEISNRMRLVHRDDVTEPGLWMADAVAWSTRRALASSEPQWLYQVIDATTVLHAQTGVVLTISDDGAALPDGDRGPHRWAQRDAISAQPMLSSPPEYRAPAASTSPQPVGRYMASVLRQVAAVSSRVQAAGLVREVQQLRAQIDRLTRVVTASGGITAAGEDHGRVTHEPVDERSAHRPGHHEPDLS